MTVSQMKLETQIEGNEGLTPAASFLKTAKTERNYGALTCVKCVRGK